MTSMTDKMHITAGLCMSRGVRCFRLSIRDEHEEALRLSWGSNIYLRFKVVKQNDVQKKKGIRTIIVFPHEGGNKLCMVQPPSKGSHIYFTVQWQIGKDMPWLLGIRNTMVLSVQEWTRHGLVLNFKVPVTKIRAPRERTTSLIPPSHLRSARDIDLTNPGTLDMLETGVQKTMNTLNNLIAGLDDTFEVKVRLRQERDGGPVVASVIETKERSL